MTDSATSIINLRYEQADVYCGRGSAYGNPYKIGVDGTRDDVCDKFELYFLKRLQDSKYRAMVMSLKGKRLGCYCKPLRCHLDTIKKYLDEAR